MDLASYLQRIQYTEHPKPDLSTLVQLQRTHMQTVPFENLDIGLGRRIQLDEKSLWQKLIINRRGGFCYELNGLFAWLLKEIGLEVTYLNARVFNSTGEMGIDFDHLALLVQIPNNTTRWIVDVGAGDSFNEPLKLDERDEQVQGLRAYKLEQKDNGFIVRQKNYDGTWKKQYFFNLTPHRFPDEYQAACLYHQTSPETPFTRKSVITRATEDGRITLENEQLIVTKNGVRKERPLANDTEYKNLLNEYFGVVL